MIASIPQTLVKLVLLQLVIQGWVFSGDGCQVSKDLCAVYGEAGEQDELLPGGAEQAGAVLDGQLTEEGELLDPRDLTEQQLICQTAQQGKKLHLGYPEPGWDVGRGRGEDKGELVLRSESIFQLEN